MANPAPTINQINAFNATQGTTIDFNIIGGTDLVRSNRIYIYDLSDNSLICTHLYVSTESIHELPPNTDASMVYESGKSSADFVNGAQYYAQIQTFTDIGGTEGGSGLSVAKMFWCLDDPTLTINTIPSTISTTSYNVSATYDANTSVVSNIIQQYQFSLYSATGSLLQSSGVVVGNGEQQGTSTAYDISYNFTGLSVGSSYYVVVDVTTTQGMSVSAQSGTFTVSIDTPTLGEATVVNNACDGYISVTSNLSSEYGGSGSGDIVSFETDSENVFTKLQVALEATQSGTGTPSPSNVRPIYGVGEVDVDVDGKNLCYKSTLNYAIGLDGNGVKYFNAGAGTVIYAKVVEGQAYCISGATINRFVCAYFDGEPQANEHSDDWVYADNFTTYTRFTATKTGVVSLYINNGNVDTSTAQVELGSTPSAYVPYVDPTTVSQEFDVSLTPTSKDTDPYLFKAVGDIYGDRLEDVLVGGSVVWNQLFGELGWDYWTKTTQTNLSVSNGIATMTLNTTPTRTYDAAILYKQFKAIANHKYLVSVVAKVPRDGTFTCDSNTVFGANKNFTLSANVWSNVAFIGTRTTDLKGDVYFFPNAITGSYVNGDSWQMKEAVVVDLTQYFGNATIADAIYTMEQNTAGSGVAFMRKYFPKLFTADYDTGTIKSVEATAHVTRGVNAWDGTKNDGAYWSDAGVLTSYGFNSCTSKIRVLPNEPYYFHDASANITVKWFTENMELISKQDITAGASLRIYTSPSTAYYVTVNYSGSTFPTEWCVNISNPTINGKYFPYEEHTYELGNETLNGVFQLVDNKLKAYGDVRHADGGTDRKYGTIIFDGTEDWRASSNANRYYLDLSVATFGYKNAPAISENYIFNPIVSGSINLGNKEFMLWSATEQFREIIFCDDSIADVSAWKAKLASNPISVVYELATPTTEQTDPFTKIQSVSKYGTLEYITTNGIPVGHNTTYMTRDIFGGYVDLVSGRLVVTHTVIDGGTLNWIYWTNNSFYASITGKTATSRTDVLCDIYQTEDSTTTDESIYCLLNNDFQLGAVYINDSTLSADESGATALKAKLSGYSIWYRLATPLTYQLTPQQIQTLVGVNNVWSEDGDVELAYHIPITDLLVKRQDVDDVSGNWLTLYSQPVEQASDMDFTFIDFLNQYGKTYKYALVPLLTQTQSGVEVEVEGGYTVSDEVQSIFDGVFISDSTGSQKCKANVGYGNVNMNQSVGSITPIGSQYPIIVTNSNNRYHNGSISGMIVPDDYYYNGNLSRIDMVNKRNELEQFLTNKRAKIIKDWNSNIWLVMIMDNIDCSFDNNYGMGIVTFNANWLEVGDPTNQEDLQATGLVDVGGV